MSNRKRQLTPEAQNSPRKGYRELYEDDHENERVSCWFCGTNLRYECIMQHELTGKIVGVGRECRKTLEQPYSFTEIETATNSAALKDRFVNDEWVFDEFDGDIAKLNQCFPKATVSATVNHKGFYQISLKSIQGREVPFTEVSDPTDLQKMRQNAYDAYRSYINSLKKRSNTF